MIEVNKIAIPFAQSGNKSTIYDNRQPEQAENEATWSTGFPPITMIRKEDGGLPPTGLDFNGIFYDISSNVVFACMGGRYKFDAEYAEKIGGYPKGAILLNDEENKQYISNIDNNKVDFNSADPVKLTQWSVIAIADIDKLLNEKVTNADFSQALSQKANTSTNINAGNGLTGGGNLTTSRTIELGTPTAITQSSTNSVTATSHTHSISKATTAQEGIVQLTNVLGTSTSLAATQKLVNDTRTNIYNDINALQKLIFDAVPVGVVKAYIGETAPNDKWLLCRGQAFSAESYPDLAQLLPDLKIPDLRGVALRGLDANRGLDPGRALLSYQEDAMQKITGDFSFLGVEWADSHGVFTHRDKEWDHGHQSFPTEAVSGITVFYDNSLVARTSHETVMKNVAVNFIIKAR